MNEANEAFELAVQYANEQISWYDFHAGLKLYLFRLAGVIAIASTIFVTYLSATLDDANSRFCGLRRQTLVAALATLSALSIALSGFFGWRSSWESHRQAQLQLEALVVDARIEKLRIAKNGNEAELFELAQSLSKRTREIVARETGKFFSKTSDIGSSAAGKKKDK